MTPTRNTPRGSLAAALALCLLAPHATGCDRDEPGGAATGTEEITEVVAEVVKVIGPGGFQAAGAAPGSFLGAGAQLAADTDLSLPHGTVAELRVGPIGVRVNEDARLSLDRGGQSLHLHAGELLVQVPRGAGGLKVFAGDDVIDVGAGEARILHDGERGAYAALDGRARLVSGDREVVLDAGMQLETPLAQTAGAAATPRASVRAAEGTDWARILDRVQARADAIPLGVGSLTAREAGSKYEFQPLSVGQQQVQVHIAGRVAHTRVQQRFDNDSSKVLEGIYRFPLPADAAISGLELLIGDEWMPAEMVEKRRAARIFQAIVDATVPRDPALLEWERGSEFKMRIFPIPARGARSVRISYTQVLQEQAGTLRYRYPMAGSGSGASGTSIGEFQFDAYIARDGLSADAAARLRVLTLNPERQASDTQLHLHAEERDFVPVRDLGFDVPLSDGEQRLHQEAVVAPDGKGYFLLSLAPELPATPAAYGHTDYALVLDRSHSTTPELWSLAATLVQAMVDRMPEGDRYELLACDSACSAMHGSLREADDSAAAAIKAFIEGQDLSGASDLGGAIRTAAAQLPAQAGRARVIVYLGDGVASAGELGPERIAAYVRPALDGVVLEALALGARADVETLRAVTEAGAGDVMQVDLSDDPKRLARTLSLRVRYPAVTDLSLQLPSAAYDVHPKQLPPMRPGQRLVVVGKLRGPLVGDARLTGSGVSETFPVSLRAEALPTDAPERHLARTWAREEIAHLTRTAGDAAREDIVALSQQHHVMSRYTSLLALENDAMYREFGVARRDVKQDGWDGSLDADAPDDAALQAATAEAGEIVEESRAEAPIVLDEEEAQEDTEDDAEPMPEAEPAPGSAPRRKADNRKRARKPKARTPRSRPSPAPSAPPPPAKATAKGAQTGGPSDDALGGLGKLGSAGAGRGASSGADSSAEGSGASEREAQRIPDRGRRPTPHPRPRPRPRPKPQRRRPTLRVSAAGAPGPRTLARIDDLRSQRDTTPDKRSTHRDLVRTAIVAGHPDAGVYASAWVMADPDHLRALRALADTLASAGDPRAMRAYASAVDIVPTSKRYQRNIASAHERRGELWRACAHRRALVAIDPQDGDAQAALVTCLLRASQQASGGDGRQAQARGLQDARDAQARGLQDARDAQARGLQDARDAQARAMREARSHRDAVAATQRAVEAGKAPDAPTAYLHPGARMRATLRWEQPGVQLDIGVIDARGRRLSALFSDALAVRDGTNQQTVTLQRLAGSVYLEVTRRDQPDPDRYREGTPSGTSPADATPIDATLKVGNRSYPVTLTGGSVRVAKVTPGFRR